MTTDLPHLTDKIARHARPDRVKHLVVARESNTGDLPLLEGMVMQTLERYRSNLSGADRLLEIGITPITDETERRRLRGHPLDHLGSKSVIFSVDDTVCLYSRGSAAKDESEKRENGFVEVLCHTIDLLRPEHIYAATFSRLVRSFEKAGPIQVAIEHAGSTLHYGEGSSLNFSEQRAYLDWVMMSAFATMEREALVNRMMLGRVGKHRQGRWIHGPAAVPMGYVPDEQNRIVVDTRPGVKQAVNKVIRLMGDPRVSQRELALAIAAIGVQPPGQRRGSVWTYSPLWEWDGKRYVPRAHREPQDDVTSTRAAGSGSDTGGDVEGDTLDTEPRGGDPGDDRSSTEATNEERPGVAPEARPRPGSDPRRADTDGRGTRAANEDRPTRLSDYAVPGLFAARLAESLDLWQTGRLTLTFGNPLKKVTRYAEYLVHDNDHGPGHVRFPYEPGLPEGGWATPEEFAAARAVRAELLASRSPHAHAKPAQMPLLGNLGRWEEKGYWYALLSASSDRRGRYELRRLPADSPRPRDNRSAPGPRFIHQSVKLGERIAIVDAEDLHDALATALVEAITTGTDVHPHPEYPPPCLAPVAAADLAVLDERHTAAQAKARRTRALLADSDKFSPGLFQQFVIDAEQAHTEAEEAAAALEEARTGPGVRYPDQFRASPDHLARALAVLANTTRTVPRDVTQAIQSVLTGLRLRPSGLTVHCEVHADIPVTDGLLRVGPVYFDVPQRLGAPGRTRRSGRRRTGFARTRANVAGHAHGEAAYAEAARARSELVARRLLTTDDAIVDIADSRAFDGAAERERALRWLTDTGMPRLGALRALSCVPLVTRATIWHILTGDPPPAGLDPHFVDRIRQTYFDPAITHSHWWQPMARRRDVIDYLREHPATATTLDIRDLLAALGAPASAYTSMMDKNTAKRGDQVALRPFTVDHEQSPRNCRPDCKPRCYDHRRVRLLPCPHCGHSADHYIPAAELSTSLLCGTCLREPLPGDDAPVFPSEYLTLTTGQALRRRATTNPARDKQAAKVTVPTTWRELATEWARANGSLDRDAGLTNTHLRAYLTAVADGEALDTNAIRRWALDAGHDVSLRGPLPDRLITAYRRHFAEQHPATARDWARKHGHPVPRHDPIPAETLEAFAAHRATTPDTRPRTQSRRTKKRH